MKKTKLLPRHPKKSQTKMADMVNGADPKNSHKQPLTQTSKKKIRIPKVLKILSVVLIIIAFFVTFLGFIIIGPILAIKDQAPALQTSIQQTVDALKNQDLTQAEQNLQTAKENFKNIKSEFQKLRLLKFSPARAYYLDGERMIAVADSGFNAADQLLTAIEPYADVLGFSGEGSFQGGTAEDRIIKIIETVDKVAPSLDQVAQELQTIDQHLSQIDPQRYQIEYQGKLISDYLIKAQDVVGTASTTLTDLRPLLDVIPEVAGLNGEKKYLVIFQNDAEIRPTGGFMTAFGVIRVDKGRIYQERSDDIYEIDKKFNSRLKPPEPIQKYLPLVNYWYLRDMNLSPDFKVSMDQFLKYYLELPGEPEDISGVIAVDTQLLTDLVRILGPIDVPGFGTFSSEIDERCDCPQVIYQLEDISTRPVAYVRDDRKAFLVPMMQTLIQKAYSAPSAVWDNLFQDIIKNIQQKHVLFYMFDQEPQSAVESANIGGRLRSFEGDYLHISDTNFGGAKSDLFITQEIQDDITLADDKAVHQLTVTYKNPAPASNCNLEAGQLCLNGIYRDYVRFYLPKGAELIEALGLEEGTVQTYQDLEYTVIEGFFKFSPQSQAKLKLHYEVNYQPEDRYRLLIQKQPGKKAPLYTITLNDVDQQQFELLIDKVVEFDL